MAEKPFDAKGTGVEIAIATAAGGATAGPGGAAAAGGAAALNGVINWTRDKRFAQSALAELQSDRVAEAIEEAGRVIEAMRMAGHTPREDWYEVDAHGEKVRAFPSGIELLEGSLISAANEFERRKVKLIANLWAQLSFNPTVGFDEGVYMVKLVTDLAYHQLAILATITEMSGTPPTAEDAGLNLAIASGEVIRPNTGHENKHRFTGSPTIALHVLDLIQRDVARQNRGTEIPSNARQVKPWRCSPTVMGQRIYILTAMRTHVPVIDKQELAAELIMHD